MTRLRVAASVAVLFLLVSVFGCQAANKPVSVKPEAAKEQGGDKQTTGKVVAEIGDEKITLEEIDNMISDVPEQYRAMAMAHKDLFLDSVINQKLLYGEAVKLNLEKEAAVKKQIEEVAKELVIKEYLRKEIEQKVTVSDADAKAYYDSNTDKFKEPEKIKVSHILVDSEADAKDVLAKLKGGADFGALAKEKSKCPSKEKGGDLGWLSNGQTVPEFEAVAIALKPGELSDVIKTQFGYHVIKVTEKQPEKNLSFEEVKDQLKQMLLSQKQKDQFDILLSELKDKNKVVVYKDVLMPPSEEKGEEAVVTIPAKEEPQQAAPVAPAVEAKPVN